MNWLLTIFRNFSVKLVLGALIYFQRMLAKKIETQIDSEVVDLRNNFQKSKTNLKFLQFNNPNFPLRGFVTCSQCGKKLTGLYSRGRSKKYPYYMCQNSSKHLNIGKEKLEQLFYDELKYLEPEPKLLKLFEVIVKNIWREHNKSQQKHEQSLKRQIEELHEKQYLIEELVIAGTFEKEAYKRKKIETEDEIKVKTIELSKSNIDTDELKHQI